MASRFLAIYIRVDRELKEGKGSIMIYLMTLSIILLLFSAWVATSLAFPARGFRFFCPNRECFNARWLLHCLMPSVLDLHIKSDRSCFLRASLLIPPIADEMIAYKNHFSFVFSLVDFLFFSLYRALWIWTDKTYSGARLIYDVH